MACRNLCSAFKAKKPNKIGRYDAGQKRCKVCDTYIYCEGYWGPCCNTKVRTKSRYIQLKKRIAFS